MGAGGGGGGGGQRLDSQHPGQTEGFLMRSRLRDRTWVFGSIVESADRVSKAGLGKGSEDV